MSIKNSNITETSDAMEFLDELLGGPLTFRELLNAIRLCDEISQVDFARKLNISKSHLCDIEKGRKNVSVERAAHFARTLQYSVDQFVRLALQDQLSSAGLDYKVHLEVA